MFIRRWIIQIYKRRMRRKYGMRGYGTPLFEPQEHGYRCPRGHANITWSEFKEHIWCYDCEMDFHYAKDCIMISDDYNPKKLPMQPFMIHGIDNFTEDGNSFNEVPIGKIPWRVYKKPIWRMRTG